MIGEELLTLPAAARLLGKHVDTVRRWVEAGDKSGVKLEAIRLPGGWHTSREALERFAARLRGEQPPDPPRSPAETNRAYKAAMEELKRRGVL